MMRRMGSVGAGGRLDRKVRSGDPGIRSTKNQWTFAAMSTQVTAK